MKMNATLTRTRPFEQFKIFHPDKAITLVCHHHETHITRHSYPSHSSPPLETLKNASHLFPFPSSLFLTISHSPVLFPCISLSFSVIRRPRKMSQHVHARAFLLFIRRERARCSRIRDRSRGKSNTRASERAWDSQSAFFARNKAPTL